MKYYREGVPETESPCARPAIEPVGWVVCHARRGVRQTRFGTIVFRQACVIVWKRYSISARELGAKKLGAIDPSALIVRRLKEVV